MTRMIRFIVALTCLTAACGLDDSHPTQVPAEDRPSILLVTIDSWRWDHLSATGLGRVQTPTLDKIAAEGLHIPQAQSSHPVTAPAHASILTGLIPRRHGVRADFGFQLREGVPTLATITADAGYQTLAVTSSPSLHARTGLFRGFEVRAPATSERTAEETVDRTLRLLKDRSDTGRPTLLWVHFADPNEPWSPPAAHAVAHPYSGEVAFVDAELGRLLGGLEADDWIIAVTGDHGEGLASHGEITHGLTLYQTSLAVPMLFRPAPKMKPTNAAVGIVDLLPTVLDLAGLPAPTSDGSSLGRPLDADRAVISEALRPAFSFGVEPAFAVRVGDRIWLRQETEEVYDIGVDPNQGRDLGPADPFAARAREILEAALGEDPWGEVATARQFEDDLGMTWRSPALENLDLETLLVVAANLREARSIASSGQKDEAIGGLFRAQGALPRSALVHRELGLALASSGRFPEAFAALRESVHLDPTDPISTFNLGLLEVRRGDVPAAAQQFRRTLDWREENPDAHLNLGVLLMEQLGDPEAGRGHLSRFLELAPEDPRAATVRQTLSESSP